MHYAKALAGSALRRNLSDSYRHQLTDTNSQLVLLAALAMPIILPPYTWQR